jgi:hypothetical protein
MQEHLRDRILRKLDTLSDERGYQVLDFVEFLESRYGERVAPSNLAANAFTRFTDAVEDSLRAGKVSATAIAETVGLMNRAASVLSGAVNATKAAANELVTPAAPREASSPARETPAPGSGQEKL